MAFEKGNTHAKKGKLFERAIKGCLADNDYQRLRGIAEQVVALAEEGERWAIEMLRDTLDGKPAQQIEAVDGEGRSLAIGLIAYATGSGDPLPVQSQALPAPGIEIPRLWDQAGRSHLAPASGEREDIHQLDS